MIYDCFTFRDEFDMLEIRFKILDKVVDKFVICEADRTFTNESKPFNFQLNQDRFKQWEDKIIYLPVELDDGGLDFSVKDTKYNPYSAAWMLEGQQRSGLILGLSEAKKDDVIMLGDVDEIPHPKSVKHYSNPTTCVNDFFYYYVNNKSMGPQDAQWLGTCFVPFNRLNEFPHFEKMRGSRERFNLIKSGWHLSYMGGKEMIQNKIKTISHTEYNNENYYNDKHIDECLLNGKDVFKRDTMNFKLINPTEYYPDYIIDIFKDYKGFIYDSQGIN